MTIEQQATSLKHEEIVSLLIRVDELQHQLSWFKKQLFGPKSERRLVDTVDSRQQTLGEALTSAPALPAAATTTVKSHGRQTRKPTDASSGGRHLQFDDSVPIEVVNLPVPNLDSYAPDSYKIIGEKVSFRLAQKPSSYCIIKYIRPVVKLLDQDEVGNDRIVCSALPSVVFEKSPFDASFLAKLLIEKFLFYLPLYRQHLRLEMAGIRISRSTLTSLVHRMGALLEPVYLALLSSVLASDLVTMDETTIKAGRRKRQGMKHGKMRTGYFWPIYGDQQEVVFPFHMSRGSEVVEELLADFKGTLLTDGYSVYEGFAKVRPDVLHAQCMSHARRKFIEAEAAEPVLSSEAIHRLAKLYAHEATIRERGLKDGAKLEYRTQYCKPVVEEFFEWLENVLQEQVLLPSSPFTIAANYASERKDSLMVFLQDPKVPVDTNHLEREIRPIALGRKNWMFSWTEVGARHIGIFQSLLATCRLHDIDPYTYLVDVLQRVEVHPASEVHLLTPRLWKKCFADSPIKSGLELAMSTTA